MHILHKMQIFVPNEQKYCANRADRAKYFAKRKRLLSGEILTQRKLGAIGAK